MHLPACESRVSEMEILTGPISRKRQLDERPLIIIDDLFLPDFINVFDRFLKTLPFSLADYDTKAVRHVLHWIHEFALEAVKTHPLLSFVYSVIRSAAEKACPEPHTQLKRVHCNTSLYGDMQFPHCD